MCIASVDVRQHALWLARIAGIASVDAQWLTRIALVDVRQLAIWLARIALADAQWLTRITSVDAWWSARHLAHWLAG